MFTISTVDRGVPNDPQSFPDSGSNQVPTKKSHLTPEGLSKLQSELNSLLTDRRQEVALRIQRANEIGGTVDNAEYDDAKNQQAFVEGRIIDLQSIIENAILIDTKNKTSDTVKVGSKVIVSSVKGKKTSYTIVGSAEANPLEGRISNESPVGKALLNKKVGEEIQVRTPAGMTMLIIAKIK